MDRTAADSMLADTDLIPVLEAQVSGAKELERQLLANDIPVLLAKPPPKACCGGSCGCGSKLQLLVREADVPKVGQFMQSEWVRALEREGMGGGLVQLGVEVEGPLACPACGFTGAMVDGACGDCGLQLE
jgi:hypothetical protein